MNLRQLFQRSVQLHGERPALALGNETALDYRTLDRRVRALAYWLTHAMGLVAGDRIMLAMKNCPQYFELMLAAWHADLCVVPVNSKLHPSEIHYMLQDCGARLCLVQRDLFLALQPAAAAIEGLTLFDVGTDAYTHALQSPLLPAQRRPETAAATPGAAAVADGDRLAWLFYTSGTTGRPKGVMLSHANLISMALNFYADLQTVDSDDVLLHVAPMSHGSGLYSIIYMIKGGLQLVPVSGGLDEDELFELLRVHRKVSLFAAPTIVTRMMQHTRSHTVTWPGLRTLLVGGAPFYVEDIKQAVHCFGPHIAQVYGQGESPMTIAAMSSATLSKAVHDDDVELLASVGFTQTGMYVDIVDESGRPLPSGTAGEVAVRGEAVMSGYWQNPTATAKTLIDGALRTGDIGLIDARGLLHLKDRSKDVIISGGTNIYPREVEEALLRHPGVEEVSVVGMPDPEWGESVVAFVVRRATGLDASSGAAATPSASAVSEVSETELDAVCIAAIARFKRPKKYYFVQDLPKNGTGKVLKRELHKLLERLL
ncbi:AMP-binding protein [Paraburkholderia xenovorans]